MSGRRQLTLALVAETVGAAGMLLLAGRTWQTISAPRPRPLADRVLDVSGRSLEPAMSALALVALAGVVAILATRGIARRVVGALVVLTGLGLAWRAVTELAAASPGRALSLLRDADSGIGLDSSRPLGGHVHAVWPVLALLAALLVVAAGAVTTWRGHTWVALSNRYEAPATQGRAERAQADATLWNALDRGDDPTAHTES